MSTTTADAVIVSGSADVDLGTADVTVINAEIATGGITANITNAGASAEAVITTNTGNDTLTLNDNAVAFTVNAGDGDNVITLTDTATATGVTTGSGNDTINLNDTDAAEVTQVTTGAGDDMSTLRMVLARTTSPIPARVTTRSSLRALLLGSQRIQGMITTPSRLIRVRLT